jgi:Domain of unknown function (DUF4942)
VFDPDFYPTPAPVIEKMLGAFKLRGRKSETAIRTVLEPSAGKGDILDWVVEHCRVYGGYNGPKMHAIEQHPELVGILQSKGHKVVGKDFLTFTPETRYDLIAMNPPFSEGAKHLLHAWDIADGAHIVCLLNAETIRNPYTQERKLLQGHIEAHGSVEYLGDAFKDAERSTGVEIALVRLFRPRHSDDAFAFSFDAPMYKEGSVDLGLDTGEGSALMRPDQMGALIRQYEKSKEAFRNYLKARAEMTFYCQGVLDYSQVQEAAAEAAKESYGCYTLEEQYDAFKDSLRLKFWQHILGCMGIEKLLTHKMRSNFAEFVKQQGAMALTKENIASIVQMLLLNSDSILSQSVVAVFDLFTSYHKENRLITEGWKTNDFWRVNRKVILPNYVQCSTGRYGPCTFSTACGRYSEYSDIDKAMCYLSGKRLEDVVTVEKAIKENSTTNEAESTFFKLRYFKKGTLHLVFKDEALWAKFNQVACDGKNWLGG